MPMSPALLIVVLFLIGLALLAGELFLPTQGVLGVLGCGAIIWGIGQAFMLNQWLGLALLLATLVAAPFIVTAAVNVWPHTPIGRRMILREPQPTDSPLRPPRVGIGQTGVAISELRPIGVCEFDHERHEARAETGSIRAGAAVKVARIDDGRIVVRAAEA